MDYIIFYLPLQEGDLLLCFLKKTMPNQMLNKNTFTHCSSYVVFLEKALLYLCFQFTHIHFHLCIYTTINSLFLQYKSAMTTDTVGPQATINMTAIHINSTPVLRQKGVFHFILFNTREWSQIYRETQVSKMNLRLSYVLPGAQSTI